MQHSDPINSFPFMVGIHHPHKRGGVLLFYLTICLTLKQNFVAFESLGCWCYGFLHGVHVPRTAWCPVKLRRFIAVVK